MKHLKFLFVFLSLNIFSQENFLKKSCDTILLSKYKTIEFENSDFKTGLINEGAYFISDFLQLKTFLKTLMSKQLLKKLKKYSLT